MGRAVWAIVMQNAKSNYQEFGVYYDAEPVSEEQKPLCPSLRLYNRGLFLFTLAFPACMAGVAFLAPDRDNSGNGIPFAILWIAGGGLGAVLFTWLAFFLLFLPWANRLDATLMRTKEV